MSALESAIQKAIRLRLSELRAGVFLRYQVGLFYAPNGQPVRIGEPGVSDLIGITPHVVTQADVGRTIGVFTAIETKRLGKDSTSKARKESQGNFLKLVNSLGGLGCIARSTGDAEALIQDKWDSEPVRKQTP